MAKKLFHLGFEKSQGPERKAELAWGLEKQAVFDRKLSERKAMLRDSLFPVLKRRTRKFIYSQTAKVKKEVKDLGVSEVHGLPLMILDVDTFIINSLPIPKEQKLKARNVLEHEVSLSMCAGRAELGMPVERQILLRVLERAKTDFERLPKKERERHPNPKFVELAGKELDRIKRSKASHFTVAFSFVLQMKQVNSLVLRRIIGDEMTSLYAAVYSSIKYRLNRKFH